MEQEGNDDEGIQDEDIPHAKRIRMEAMVLDADEIEIASGLRPISSIHRAVSHLPEDEARNQDGDSGAQGEGDMGDSNDDGAIGFEDNGVCG
jgi:hypothetical protein